MERQPQDCTFRNTERKTVARPSSNWSTHRKTRVRRIDNGAFFSTSVRACVRVLVTNCREKEERKETHTTKQKKATLKLHRCSRGRYIIKYQKETTARRACLCVAIYNKVLREEIAHLLPLLTVAFKREEALAIALCPRLLDDVVVCPSNGVWQFIHSGASESCCHMERGSTFGASGMMVF